MPVERQYHVEYYSDPLHPLVASGGYGGNEREVDGIPTANYCMYSCGFFNLKDDVPVSHELQEQDSEGFITVHSLFTYTVDYAKEAEDVCIEHNGIMRPLYTVVFEKVDPYITDLSSPA